MNTETDKKERRRRRRRRGMKWVTRTGTMNGKDFSSVMDRRRVHGNREHQQDMGVKGEKGNPSLWPHFSLRTYNPLSFSLSLAEEGDEIIEIFISPFFHHHSLSLHPRVQSFLPVFTVSTPSFSPFFCLILHPCFLSYSLAEQPSQSEGL